MKKFEAPGQNVPIQRPDGSIDPVWYEFLTKRGVLDMPDVNNSTPITNGQVLVYNGTSRKLTPGAN